MASHNDHEHGHTETHEHSAGGGHGHVHGVVDPSIISTEKGVRAVLWSLVGLLVTALLQLVVVLLTGSVALLADTIHNFGDATTAIPLWIAFTLARRAPNKRFTYGYGRVEDLAGVAIVLMILISSVVAGYESFRRLLNPQPVSLPLIVALAALIGFAGNELVAQYRLKIGREIGSAALIADGYHARSDGLTSLAVLAGVAGSWLGFPLADPLIGLLITVAIVRILWGATKQVFSRLLDGVDPTVVEEIRHTVGHVDGVENVGDVRVRWLGHRLHAEVNLAVDPKLTVEEGHQIAMAARHQLLHDLSYFSNATVHVDPGSASGESFHSVPEHSHGESEPHGHL